LMQVRRHSEPGAKGNRIAKILRMAEAPPVTSMGCLQTPRKGQNNDR
jgi:hypothetical protein